MSKIRAVLDIRGIPFQAYRLPTDGRQWQHQCQQRRALAIQFATYANAGGEHLTVGKKTLARDLGISEATVAALIEDLKQLGFLINTGKRDPKTHVYIRRLDVNKIAGKSPVLEEQESNLEDARVQSSSTKSPILIEQESNLGFGGSSLEESNLRVKPVDSAVRSDSVLQTALPSTPTHTPISPEEAEACVVCVLENPATIEYCWSPSPNERRQMKDLAQKHGRKKFLAAYDYFVKNPPAQVNAKTKFPFSYFISSFEVSVAQSTAIVNAKDRDAERKRIEEETTLWHWIRQPLERAFGYASGEAKQRDERFLQSLGEEELAYIAAVASSRGPRVSQGMPEGASHDKSLALMQNWEEYIKKHPLSTFDADDPLADLFPEVKTP